jgi:hypothetical protein
MESKDAEKHEQFHELAQAKRNSVSTWELIVLPPKPFWPRVPARACFLCGDCCVNFRDVLCDDVDEWLAQQQCLAGSVIHEVMVNMAAQTRSAQIMYDNGVTPFVAVCLSCDNYLRMHKSVPFFSGIQTLQWHINTLEEPNGVKIDKRMLYGLCTRLTRVQAGKQNYYMSLFSSEEQDVIRAVAAHKHDARAGHQALLRYFQATNKHSCLVPSASIAHKMRQYKFGRNHSNGPNVYKTSMWKRPAAASDI